MAHSVWRSVWSETHVGAGYWESFLFLPCGKMKSRAFGLDVIKKKELSVIVYSHGPRLSDHAGETCSSPAV